MYKLIMVGEASSLVALSLSHFHHGEVLIFNGDLMESRNINLSTNNTKKKNSSKKKNYGKHS